MREAKGYIDNFTLLEMVKQELEIDIEKVFCPIKSFPEKMDFTFCTTKCYSPCKSFMNFEYVTNKCHNLSCASETPCSNCLEKIEKVKVYMKCVKAIFDIDMERHKVRWRVNKHVKRREKIYKRLQAGKRKKQREKDKWKERNSGNS